MQALQSATKGNTKKQDVRELIVVEILAKDSSFFGVEGTYFNMIFGHLPPSHCHRNYSSHALITANLCMTTTHGELVFSLIKRKTTPLRILSRYVYVCL